MGEVATPEQVFVIVENEAIECSSLLHGLDVCFKLIYVLDVEFPWQCQHAWDFLQNWERGRGAVALYQP